LASQYKVLRNYSSAIFFIVFSVAYPHSFPQQEVNDLKVNLPFLIQNHSAFVNITWNFDFTGQITK